MIKVSMLKKSYGNFLALKGVSFTIDKKITSIIGRNGAGKTTLLRILSTQLLQDSGDVNINGYDVVKDTEKVRGLIMSIPQDSDLIYYRSAFDNVRVYLSARGMDAHEAKVKAESAIKRLGIWDHRNKSSNELSGGMKRKVFLAMVIASNPKIVFLDEPTTGLDPLSRLDVWSAIKTLKGQVIITTHYMEEAQALSDDVIMLEHGKLLSQGTVKDLLNPFEDIVRIESLKKRRLSYKIGNTWISYVKKKDAESFVMKGDITKPVTLDDLFIKKGVSLES